MSELETKLAADLAGSPTSEVVACRFPFPNWKPSLTIGEGIDSVWLYRQPWTLKKKDV